jgi:hypothetical protein
MSEEKKTKLRGFAGIVSKQVEPLNENNKFKHIFKDTEERVLLVPKDGNWSAMLIIDKAKIYVEGIKTKPKENLKKKNAGWQGLIACKTNVFLELLGSEGLSKGKVIGMVLIGKLKIRGLKHVLVLLKLFSL